MPTLETTQQAEMIDDFRQAMQQCEQLYHTAAEEHAQAHPLKLHQPRGRFVAEMLDLHRALILKLFLETARADLQFTAGERELAATMAEHVLGRRLSGSALTKTIHETTAQTGQLEWAHLLAPFVELDAFQRRIGELQTVVMRIANLVSKIDGVANPETVAHIKSVQYQFWQHLGRTASREQSVERRSDDHGSRQTPGVVAGNGSTCAVVGDGTRSVPATLSLPESKLARKQEEAAQELDDPAAKAERLAAALAELDALIGLEVVKREVRALINYLRLQRERQRLGLPTTSLSLHMVFSGNPGTGKTTVARIVGRIFKELGILQRGHLIETDRSGLVAEYVGQTGPKTNKKIDEALDGILFIDEAYSLVSEGGDDAFGEEAIQTLLKRNEDDRARLVVILAGYTAPIERLLRSNPGLSSRFARRLEFSDYSADQLCSILDGLCAHNKYSLDAAAREKALAGFERAVSVRDEHFGNGRMVRNVFEDAIRRMANRIAEVVPLTHEVLTTLEPEDFGLVEVS